MESADNFPKMVKYENDDCYGQSYQCSKDSCRLCWVNKSCENTYKANVKKQKTAKKGKPAKARPKKYKKTANHRDWC